MPLSAEEIERCRKWAEGSSGNAFIAISCWDGCDGGAKAFAYDDADLGFAVWKAMKDDARMREAVRTACKIFNAFEGE